MSVQYSMYERSYTTCSAVCTPNVSRFLAVHNVYYNEKVLHFIHLLSFAKFPGSMMMVRHLGVIVSDFMATAMLAAR